MWELTYSYMYMHFMILNWILICHRMIYNCSYIGNSNGVYNFKCIYMIYDTVKHTAHIFVITSIIEQSICDKCKVQSTYQKLKCTCQTKLLHCSVINSNYIHICDTFKLNCILITASNYTLNETAYLQNFKCYNI